MKKWQLQELLHVVHERHKTTTENMETIVMKKIMRRINWLDLSKEKGLPPWIHQIAQKAIYNKIRSMTTGNDPLLHWKEPLKVHSHMKLTLRDSQSNPDDPKSLESVICRAVPTFNGITAQDSIKVLIEDEEEHSSVYFAQCMAFIQDADDANYVVVRWFERLEDRYGFDNISHVPSFKLEPDNRPDSYCILPAYAILNGAVMIPGKDNRYWALLSPKEEHMYALQFAAQ
jgi:hypothetical protein